MATVEYLLLDYTQRLAKARVGRRAIIIHLSQLRPDNRRAHHIRIAANTFEGLIKQFDGQMFVLQNADIVFVCKYADVAAVDEAITRVRLLFGDDPLTSDFDDDRSDAFATWYELERDYGEFATFVQQAHDDEMRRQKRLAAITGGAAAPSEQQPMDPQALHELISTIARADLSNVMRRQAICAVAVDEAPKPIFREIYISIGALREAVMPKRDIASDRWLFQYLTQTLDKRMLALLRRHDDTALAHSFSLNLNVSTLLSPEFNAFDQNLRVGARGSVVLELQKLDIFADIGAYLFARDYVRERGYRICLDGATLLTLPFVDRERLGLDLVKVFWSPEMSGGARGERFEEFCTALERVGRPRVILARCDDEEAVRFGQSVGVRLFQGRHIDRLLSGIGSARMYDRKLSPPAAAVAH